MALKLGYFIHKAFTGELIVRMTLPKPPRLGSLVVTAGGVEVGVLTDVIGPVNKPFAVVKPFKPDVSLRDSEVLFIKPRPRRRRRGGRK